MGSKELSTAPFRRPFSDKTMVYLDYAAGTPPSPAALAAAQEAATRFYGHPEALHQPAQEAAEHLVALRRQTSDFLSVRPESLVFVAGASEANSLLIRSLKSTYPQARLACLSIDHDSWREQSDCLLPVNRCSGQVEAAAIVSLADDVVCLSLAGINNELGVIQPFAAVKRALAAVRRRRLEQGNKLPLLLHVDASQMALVCNLQPQSLAAADCLTLNGAKFYALRRSGLLYLKPGLALKPPQPGGWQPGGESLFAAAALTAALAALADRRQEQSRRLATLRDWFEDGLERLGGHIVLKDAPARAPQITTVIFGGRDNEELAIRLSQAGIYVGIGSACRSRSDLLRTSALKALGYGAGEIYGSLRFSFAYETERSQLESTLAVLKKLLKGAR